MNYSTIREKLYTDLLTVTGIGKVFRTPKFAENWKDYLNLFTIVNPHDATKKVINLTWLMRRSVSEIDTTKGGRDEAEAITAVQRDETWEITTIYGFDDDETYPSETDFQILVDNIMSEWRMMDALGLPATVEETWPVQLESAGLFYFGEVLCHRAVMTIRIQQRIIT